jgi:cardiolipin synthase
VFDPASRVLGVRLNMLRRMHRKLLVVDGERAFVGGINYSADHLGDFGPQAKQDYAVEINGPLVAEIRAFAMQAMRDRPEREGDLRNERRTPSDPARKPVPQHAGDARALFVTRDNREHHNDIERHYRAAIRRARRRVRGR